MIFIKEDVMISGYTSMPQVIKVINWHMTFKHWKRCIYELIIFRH
jgi:hypothetical protein